jgi:hypothetical protein
MEKDKDGYLLVSKEFTHKKYLFRFIKDLEGGWMIYEKTKEATKTKKYELVKPKRQDEFVLHSNIIEAKWVYPHSNSFGKIGFDCISLDVAINRHKEMLADKQEQVETTQVELKIPNGEFTMKDLLITNKIPYPKLYLKVKEMVLGNTIKKVGEKKNGRGKPSNIFKLV